MTFKFRAEDFSGLHDNYKVPGIAYCERANEVLSKHLASLPVVYGSDNVDGHKYWGPVTLSHTDLKAVLFNCEPIEKNCAHEPDRINVNTSINKFGLIDSSCIHCGAKLKATWSAE